MNEKLRQLARMNKLAQAVWPDRDATVWVSDDPEDHNATVILDYHGNWEQQLGCTHPRALDAVEAALQILASGGIGNGPEILRLKIAENRYLQRIGELKEEVASGRSLRASLLEEIADLTEEVARLRGV